MSNSRHLSPPSAFISLLLLTSAYAIDLYIHLAENFTHYKLSVLNQDVADRFANAFGNGECGYGLTLFSQNNRTYATQPVWAIPPTGDDSFAVLRYAIDTARDFYFEKCAKVPGDRYYEEFEAAKAEQASETLKEALECTALGIVALACCGRIFCLVRQRRADNHQRQQLLQASGREDGRVNVVLRKA